MASFDELLEEVVKTCSFESMSEELNERLGKACSVEDITVLIKKLDSLMDSDLEDDAGDLQDYYWRLRTSISDALAASGNIAIDPLLATLSSTNEAAASYAARSLGKMKAMRAVDAIFLKLQESKTNFERLPYISSLGELGDQRVIDQLLPYLSRSGELNGGWLVRITACALGKLGNERVVAAIGEVLASDPEWFARVGAAEGLGLLGSSRGIPFLQRALSDTDKRVVNAARVSLEQVKAKNPGGLRHFLRLVFPSSNA